MGNPRKPHIHQIKFLKVTLFHCLPSHMLPNQIYSGCPVKQNGSKGSNGCAQSRRHIPRRIRRRIQSHALNGTDGKRDADVADGPHIRGHGSARSHQSYVNHLNRRAYDNAGLHIPQNQSCHQTCHQRTPQCIISECGSA